MPELKRNFSEAKMNRDLDERIVPEGQYREAMNIQIATSDGSNVGSAQTLLGNAIRNDMSKVFSEPTSLPANAYYEVPTTATVVGSIAVPDKDKIYYLVSAGMNGVSAVSGIQKDYILEYDVVTKTLKYVFVDIYRVHTADISGNSNTTYINIPVGSSATINKTGVRIGMRINGIFVNSSGSSITHPVSGATVANGAPYTIKPTDNITVTDIIYDSGNSVWKIYTSANLSVTNGNDVYFSADRVLQFDSGNIITGINVLDDMLFWTDNTTEPKKINIKRSLAGTGGVAYLYLGGILGVAAGNPTSDIFDGDTPWFHTRLTAQKDGGGNLEVVTRKDIYAVYTEPSHVTVIKKGPTQPLELEMSRTKNPRITLSGNTVTAAGEENSSTATISAFNFYDSQTTPEILQAGDFATITLDLVTDYREGDILLFVNEDHIDGQTETNFENYLVRAVVTDSDVIGPDTLYNEIEIQILSISPSLGSSDELWYVRLENGEPLFEFKFVRFSYRYKYTDGEYSTFAPWSEIAFLTDKFEYMPKKGFNLGMRNQLRALKLKNYFTDPYEETTPSDIVEIDLLYKETNKPTVYTVKTIKPTDGTTIWPNYKEKSTLDRGEYEIKTDMIHAVVPSNQLLRPWDNVPRKALGQEVSANRLIYGNYLQNYNVFEDPIIMLSLHQRSGLNGDGYARPSVKTIRTYQVGVVYSDDHGRETPVLTNKNA